mmetsp:Transcript_27999/g.70280  ORF Transcript_27999/g.70280 Transcript_27999/m.70280 type:complete len:225 (-) Transcript_27999:193-867(-)
MARSSCSSDTRVRRASSRRSALWAESSAQALLGPRDGNASSVSARLHAAMEPVRGHSSSCTCGARAAAITGAAEKATRSASVRDSEAASRRVGATHCPACVNAVTFWPVCESSHTEPTMPCTLPGAPVRRVASDAAASLAYADRPRRTRTAECSMSSSSSPISMESTATRKLTRCCSANASLPRLGGCASLDSGVPPIVDSTMSAKSISLGEFSANEQPLNTTW